ncbi:MAG: hypothetical protein MAG451_00729 [Anaerolineales bacterium]|nr:hypothetical protein [Anaerolineales bacterium]
MRKITVALLLIAALSVSVLGIAYAQETAPVVRAVLFYSPTCPHCEQFIKEDLPLLYDTYGDQIQIIGVNTMESEGWALYQAAAEHFSIPENRRGVPALIVDDHVLVSGDEINQQFPGIIDEGLATGGISLPEIPGLQEMLPPETQSNRGAVSTASLGPVELFKRDLAGNTLALIVLLGMLASLAYVAVSGRQALRGRMAMDNPTTSSLDWLVPALALAGLGVAGYLAYVETRDIAAICGPVGDCNIVQQSQYARLFGVLPIGVLGAIGYIAILIMWAWRRIDSNNGRRAIASSALLGAAGFGVLFSIYLTFLEPFVIGATCAWCLTSAVIITALFLLTARPGLCSALALVTPPKTRTKARRQ